jgi:hypothetical protein
VQCEPASQAHTADQKQVTSDDSFVIVLARLANEEGTLVATPVTPAFRHAMLIEIDTADG